MKTLTKNLYNTSLSVVACLGLVFTLSACQEEKPDDVADEVKDVAEEVSDNVKDMADDAANEVEDLCEKAKEKANAEDTDC